MADQAILNELRQFGSVARWSSSVPTVPIHALPTGESSNSGPAAPFFDCYVGFKCGVALVSFVRDTSMDKVIVLTRESKREKHRDYTIVVPTTEELTVRTVNRAIDQLAEIAITNGANWRCAEIGSRVQLLVGRDILAI